MQIRLTSPLIRIDGEDKGSIETALIKSKGRVLLQIPRSSTPPYLNSRPSHTIEIHDRHNFMCFIIDFSHDLEWNESPTDGCLVAEIEEVPFGNF